MAQMILGYRHLQVTGSWMSHDESWGLRQSRAAGQCKLLCIESGSERAPALTSSMLAGLCLSSAREEEER